LSGRAKEHDGGGSDANKSPPEECMITLKLKVESVPPPPPPLPPPTPPRTKTRTEHRWERWARRREGGTRLGLGLGLCLKSRKRNPREWFERAFCHNHPLQRSTRSTSSRARRRARESRRRTAFQRRVRRDRLSSRRVQDSWKARRRRAYFTRVSSMLGATTPTRTFFGENFVYGSCKST